MYKRQFQSVVSKANANLKSLELFNEEKVPEDATATVSYTHLDVYKRQDRA